MEKQTICMSTITKGMLIVFSALFVYPNSSYANTVGNNVYGNKEISQQKTTITGTVTDSFGDPLPGVSIIEKGTTNGNLTDSDGKYTLAVSGASSVLQFSYVGFLTQEIAVGNQRNISITMSEDVKMMDEVIVTAYGTSKKASFTGSATVVNVESIERVQPVNLTQGLQGLSPGLQVMNNSGAPGANAEIIIRGVGSMTASNDPLYVLDGVPYAGDLNTISPTDIESITVLKDAASTALYGSRAGNGVILITTKKGAAGKVKVNLRANWGTSDFAVKFPKRSSPARQYELTFEGLYNDAKDFMTIDGQAYTDAQARQYAHDNVTSVYWYESNTTLNNGTFRKYLSDWNTDYPVGLDGKIKSDAQRLYDYDVYDEAFGHRLKQDYGIDISGGLGDKSTFYSSFSMLDDKGIYEGEQYKRANARVQITTQVNNWLTLDNSLSYVTSTNYNTSTPFRAFRNFPTVYSAFLWDHNTNDYAVSPYTGGRILDVGEQDRMWWTGWSAFGYQVEGTKKKLDQMFAKTSATITLFPFLQYKVFYAYDYTQSLNSWNRSPERGTYLKTGDGLVDRDGKRYTANTVNNLLMFDKRFGDHHVNVLAGMETYQWREDVWESKRRGLSMVGMTEQSSASGAAEAYSWNDKYRLASFLSKAEYDFQDKYYITGSFRTDGSSRFHKDNRWGQFWSVGASWRMSQESFMESTHTWLNNLKLRGSYGEVGNDNIEALYAYQGLYETSNYYDVSGVKMKRLPTPDVKWETNIQATIGIDAILFNRLNFMFEVFSRKSKDLLMEKPLAYSLGKESYLANIGDIENKGWELDIQYHAIKTKDFDWMVGVNASSYKNKITSLPMGEEIRTGETNYYVVNKWREGGSLYDIYAPLWAGVDPETGNNTWYKLIFDENGKEISREVTSNRTDVTSMDQYVKAGSSLPKLYGGFTNSFRYRDLDMSFMLYYSLGAKYYDSHYAESSGAYGANVSTEFTEKRWQKPGDITSVPKLYAKESGRTYPSAYSTQYIFKNNYLRLRNLTIGYNVPKQIVSKWGMGGIRVFATGENLLTFGKAKKHGTDPENVGIKGVVENDAGLPVRKTYNLGINVQF